MGNVKFWIYVLVSSVACMSFDIVWQLITTQFYKPKMEQIYEKFKKTHHHQDKDKHSVVV